MADRYNFVCICNRYLIKWSWGLYCFHSSKKDVMSCYSISSVFIHMTCYFNVTFGSPTSLNTCSVSVLIREGPLVWALYVIPEMPSLSWRGSTEHDLMCHLVCV